ncbi:MAG: nitrous oxide-stimulated promoter family protein [Rikenellaceae bacterium]
MSEIEREKETMQQMIRIYCRGNHTPWSGEVCGECLTLIEYATSRLDHCPFGEEKGSCRLCPIHCYKADQREKIAAVMRYSGPRMILHHPISAIRHLIKERRR